MFGWAVRLLLIVAGLITGWFVAEDATNFGVVQATVALLLFAFIVFVLAFWPSRWQHLLNRRRKPQ
jgi:uncharacterized membrane protein YoaK (UPF0700 family)